MRLAQRLQLSRFLPILPLRLPVENRATLSYTTSTSGASSLGPTQCYSSSAGPSRCLSHRPKHSRRKQPSSELPRSEAESTGEVAVEDQKTVRVAILGSANVGKSTLLNSFMQQYISPVTRYRQTTMHSVTGVLTHGNTQVVFIDTPGLMPGQFKQKHTTSPDQRQNYIISKEAIEESLSQADLVLFMFDSTESLHKVFLTADMKQIVETADNIPRILVLNKMDKEKSRAKVSAMIEQLTSPLEPPCAPPIVPRTDIDTTHLPINYEEPFRDGISFHEVVTISAYQGTNVSYLWHLVLTNAVSRPWDFSPKTVSPDSVASIITDAVRAELLVKLGYRDIFRLTHMHVGFVQEETGMLIEHAFRVDQNPFASEADSLDSAARVGEILQARFKQPVQVRFLMIWHHEWEDFVKTVQFEQDPEIEVSEGTGPEQLEQGKRKRMGKMVSNNDNADMESRKEGLTRKERDGGDDRRRTWEMMFKNNDGIK